MLVLLAVAGCSSVGAQEKPPEPMTRAPAETMEIVGAVLLEPRNAVFDVGSEGECASFVPYLEIEEGLQVTIADASGDVVGVAELGAGYVPEGSDVCAFQFGVTVPTGGEFYSATVLDWTSETMAEADLPGTALVIEP